MSLTLLFGALALAPAIAAILVLALGLARRPLLPAVIVLAILGALAPIVALLELAPDVSFTIPLRVSLLGAPVSAGFTPLLRADALGLYAAFGVSVLVVPLLVWIALYASPPQALALSSGEIVEAEGASASGERVGLLQSMLSGGQWASIALVLGLESALLMLCFADNVAWLALCWVLAVLLAWALGEVGSEPGTLDYPGLGFLLLGPVLWLVAMLFVMGVGGAPSLLDLTGFGSVTFLQALLLAIALTAAGGGYPFFVWLRRRAAFATPAGVAATVIAVIPAALFVGGRTYGALANKNGLWPVIGVATPPITFGLIFVVLGTLTVVVSGLLALGRRDARTLIALLAAAQTGWGLLAIGTEHSASAGALVLLLATTVLGMGALLGSAIVGGTVSVAEEPEGAGPRPFDKPLRMIPLLLWGIGAVTLLGIPLFAGFTVRELISAASLEGTKIAIPLIGFAWIGEALLALALLRATAPALTYTLADDEDEVVGEEDDADEADEVQEPENESVAVVSQQDEESEDQDEDEVEVEQPVGANNWRENLAVLPAALCALLALILGVAPQALFGIGANLAVGDLLPPSAFPRDVLVTSTGIIVPAGQWVPSIAWVLVLALVVVFALLRLLRTNSVAEDTDGADITDAADVADETAAEGEAEEMEASASLVAPTEAWEQLRPAFTSEWLQPGAFFLLDGTDDDEEDDETDTSEDETEDDDENADAVKEAEETSGAAITAELEPQPQDDAPAEQNGAGTTLRSKSAKRLKDNGV